MGDGKQTRFGVLIGALAATVVGLGIALAVVVAGDDSGDTKTVIRNVTVTRPGTTTTSSTQTTTPVKPISVVRLQMFKTPTGNIGCGIYEGSARCDIRKRDWTPPPKPANCELDWGQGISVGKTGDASFVCAGDTANDPAAPILDYNEDSRIGNITCASREAGVTCTNRSSGHGFLINRERYRLF